MSELPHFQSLEDAWVAFIENAPGPVPPRRAFEDRMTFFAGAIAAMDLMEAGKVAACDRDIFRLGEIVRAEENR